MSTRLYMSNLPRSAREGMLFVETNTSAAARKAIAGLNFSDFEGRLVSVYLALSHVPRKPS